MIRVLVVLECVLLLIIGFGKFVVVSTPEGSNDVVDRGVEASSEIQISSMRATILPTAAAADPTSFVSVPSVDEARSVLPVLPSESDAPFPESSYPDLFMPIFGSGTMREADRVAIARELLGSVVDDRGTPSALLETSEDNPVAVSETSPLPEPAIASRPKGATASSLARPVARPEVRTRLASVNTVVPMVKPVGDLHGQGTDSREPSSRKIAEVQRLLATLGYQVGIDGVFGKRTELAIRSFQQSRGSGVDGRISDALVSRVRAAVKNQDADASPIRRRRYDMPQKSKNIGWVSSLVAGYQRLVGHRFDSIARPRELQAYCKLQSDTWVYDEGIGRLVHCGRIATGAD